jgi:hypothetical protein
MAELNADCCNPAAQETCCERSAKGSCCGESESSGCGCSAESIQLSTGAVATATVADVRETVRAKYAAAATAAAEGTAGCGPGSRRRRLGRRAVRR